MTSFSTGLCVSEPSADITNTGIVSLRGGAAMAHGSRLSVHGYLADVIRL